MAVVGLFVMAYFTEFHQLLTPGTTIFKDADTLFPRFVRIGLPAGLTGLIAAAIMAAAMSSLSSGLNSSSTVFQEDILYRKKKNDDAKNLHIIKTISAIIGVFVCISSLLISHVPGNLLDIIFKVVNLVVGPLFVLFFLALFVPFATDKGAVFGAIF